MFNKQSIISQDFLNKHNFAEIKHDRFIIDMMYASKKNIVLEPVYNNIGFGNTAIAHKDVVARLISIIPNLEKLELKLKIKDAYRPPIAHLEILKLINVEGLFASKPENSLHCYGAAIDICLADEKGRDLKFPTEVDAYSKKFAKQLAKGIVNPFYKHLVKARQDFMDISYSKEINNRATLNRLMTNVGFKTIESEWWHFELPEAKIRYPLVDWQK